MRKAIYFLIGVLSAAVVFIMMLTTAPHVESVKTTPEDFQILKAEGELQSPHEVNGDVTSFLSHGSYRISNAEYEGFARSNTVKFGKVNPMFFYKSVQKVEEEPTSNEDNSLNMSTGLGEEDKPESIVDKNNASGGTFKQEFFKDIYEGVDPNQPINMRGFNIVNKDYEERNVAGILKDLDSIGKLPVDSEYYQVSSGFGERKDPFTDKNAIHTGIDIAAPGINGQNVYSVSYGEVVDTVISNDGYGNHVIIRHNGYDTLYGHLSSIANIKIGDKVYPGAIVGQVGSTGRSTNPHLHFEIRIDDVAMDPLSFVNRLRKAVEQ